MHTLFESNAVEDFEVTIRSVLPQLFSLDNVLRNCTDLNRIKEACNKETDLFIAEFNSNVFLYFLLLLPLLALALPSVVQAYEASTTAMAEFDVSTEASSEPKTIDFFANTFANTGIPR